MQRAFLERRLMKSKFVILLVFIPQCGTAFGERDIMIAIILNTLTLLNNKPRTFWKRKKVQLQFQWRKFRCYFWPDNLNSEYYFMDKRYQLINIRIDKGSNEYKAECTTLGFGHGFINSSKYFQEWESYTDLH